MTRLASLCTLHIPDTLPMQRVPAAVHATAHEFVNIGDAGLITIHECSPAKNEYCNESRGSCGQCPRHYHDSTG
jgi:hypothetical protein